MKPLVITVYVPLCTEHCTFCNKLKCRSTLTMVNRYSKAVLAEVDAVAPELNDYEVAAVRFTGGIPLLLGGTNVALILNHLRKQMTFSPDVEVTVETVTDKLDEYNLQMFNQVGINRLEVFTPTLIGSEHRNLQAPGVFGHLSEIESMRSYLGPQNWGLHLLYGFDGQTEETWARTLEKAVLLEPLSIRLEAISADELAAMRVVEDGNEQTKDVPEDEDGVGVTTPKATPIPNASMLATLRKQAERYLLEHGYEPAALGYFAKPEAAPKWATLVAQDVDQLGIGAGTASRWDGFGYINTSDIAQYVAHSDDPEQVIVEAFECE